MLLHSIGWVESCFREKFGTPRQPGLIATAEATLVLPAPYGSAESVRDLEQFSHLWVLFLFHQTAAKGWQPLVRPPRLGGNRKSGLWATRSMFRPNPIGLSVVELVAIEITKTQVELQIRGQDIIDKTPIIDIKPYLPWVDAVTDAKGGEYQRPPTATLSIEWSPAALQQLAQLSDRGESLRPLLEQVIAQNPRPAYQGDSREYGLWLEQFNFRWRVEEERVTVMAVERWEG